MDDIKIKKDIIEKIKSSTNILITVSNDPSVDELSAALGLTLSLNKIEKSATAIFSGATPPAISFLEPEKTFEENTDSLRDFIIALNKEKADHLRFKPEGDFVRIYITPYRSVITAEDLEFSQGDFNVELVIALGVEEKNQLDDALDNHGQILHDATVVSVTTGEKPSSLGSINWHNPGVSSLSELVAGLVESLKEDKKDSIIDAPIATALLTGIVSETDRFSNSKTTSHVMTVAANLMSSGADQQLIANELQQAVASAGNVIDVESGASKGQTLAELEESVKSKDKDKSGDSAYTLNIQRDEEPSSVYALPEEEIVAEEPAPVEEEKIVTDPVDTPGQTESAAEARLDLEENGAIQTDGEGGYISNKGETVIQPLSEAPVPAQAVVPTPTDLGLPMPPELPDDIVAPSVPQGVYSQPEVLGDILAPDSAAQPIAEAQDSSISSGQVNPDANSAYAFNPEPAASAEVIPTPSAEPAPAVAATPVAPTNPGQFQIPPQQ